MYKIKKKIIFIYTFKCNMSSKFKMNLLPSVLFYMEYIKIDLLWKTFPVNITGSIHQFVCRKNVYNNI